MAETKKYWKGLEELSDSPVVQVLRENEFASELPVDRFLADDKSMNSSATSRRDFLKFLGFSTAAAALAACEAPVVESIPYVVKPDNLVPGVPSYYASTYFDGVDFASILVKSREGRPIKIEPNAQALINGSTNARIQASVLSLYDTQRLKKPLVDGAEADWSALDRKVSDSIRSATASGKSVVLLSSTVNSPTYLAMLEEIRSTVANFRHVSYDALSVSGKLDACEKMTGMRALPVYSLADAQMIVGVDADFLNEANGQSLTADYGKGRKPSAEMLRHVQFESVMSLTGANADKRFRILPSQRAAVLSALYNAIARRAGQQGVKETALEAELAKSVAKTAEELWNHRGRSLVLAGGGDYTSEMLALGISRLLENFGSTLTFKYRNQLRTGDESALQGLVNDLKAGSVGVLILDRCNPVYDRPEMAEALSKAGLLVSLSEHLDESASMAGAVAPAHHFLEDWCDHQPVQGYFAMQQPVIRPLFDTRSTLESVDRWFGLGGKSALGRVKDHWLNGRFAGNVDRWNEFVHDGVFVAFDEIMALAEPSASTDPTLMDGLTFSSAGAQGLELAVYTKAGMGTGRLANNPWLQEFPDPITRTSWDNYLTISASDAKEIGLENTTQSNGALNGSRVRITTAQGKVLDMVPVLIQPGQAKGSVGLAVGYGRTKAGKVGDGVGVNAFALLTGAEAQQQFLSGVKIEPVEGEHEFACVQLHHTMMGRDIVREVSLGDFLNKPAKDGGLGWNERTEFETYAGPMNADKVNLWKDFDHTTGHFWNLSIDLNSCIGCGACVIACHAENNVPVVGKDEIRRSRDMHWLRIDRYFSSEMTEEVAEEQSLGAIEKFRLMEDPSENPQVVFQPVMCQHCNHAPCETVCPVAATSHSAEGLNHMAYNRCIGTRYCANNCPYKVRRFNWFLYHDNQEQFDINYAMNDDLGRMVLNPDVTVRSRGVMEKCSMCVQRTQYAKLEAKKAGRMLKDGDAVTACAQACDTGALVFGDANDAESKIAAAKKNDRMYYLLDEVGTQPSVFYQVKVRNNA
ncbi:4Fe-4S dicluster domain-containing protein [bacterium]|nr:4Fe-4S dicluster domain-containing protein [bacterium]